MAEKIKVPAGVYDMVTRCMEQEFPDNVAIRYVAEDGKTVVEKHYREYARDIRKMVTYLKNEVPDLKGRSVVLLSRNCYEFCVASYGIILAGGVLVTLNQKKTWDELEYELGQVEPALILNDGIDYGCRAQLEAAYGPLLRPMDCYKDSTPGELTNCVDHDGLMMLMFLRHHRPQQGRHALGAEHVLHAGHLLRGGRKLDHQPPARGPEAASEPHDPAAALPHGLLCLRHVLPAGRLGPEPLR